MRATRLPALLAVVLAAGLFAGLSAQTPDPAPVLAAARTAMGGDSRLAGVRTVVVTGRTRLVRGRNLVPIEFEIACELPDRYVRLNEIPAEETGLMKSGFNGDRLIQGPSPARDAQADPATRAALLTSTKQDFARWSVGLFAASFTAHPLTFSYAGRAQAPEGAADAISITGPDNFAARLFIDTTSHLPVMLTWQAQKAEQRLYYSDYRDVGGLRWPFLIRRASGGETIEETTIDRYRVNSSIDSRKFETVR